MRHPTCDECHQAMTYMGEGPGWECHDPKCPGNRPAPGVAVQSPTPPGLTPADMEVSIASYNPKIVRFECGGPHLATVTLPTEAHAAAVVAALTPKAPPELKGAREWWIKIDNETGYRDVWDDAPSVDERTQSDDLTFIHVREVLPLEGQ